MSTEPERTFVADLVSYFAQKPEVRTATFAFLYSSVSQTHDLFLGVEHTGELEGLKAMALFIKNAYLPESPMFFASSEEDPDTYALVQEQGLAFYSQQEDLAVAQKALECLFGTATDAELRDTVRAHGVYALVHEAQLAEKKLVVQSFAKEEGPFTPLFSSPQLAAAGGLAAPPAGLALARLVWGQHLAGAAPRPVVLNPDTPFAVAFEL